MVMLRPHPSHLAANAPLRYANATLLLAGPGPIGACTAMTKRGPSLVAQSDTTNPDRRDFLYIATGAVGAVAVGAMVVPLVDQMNASADTRAVAQIRVDISQVAVGQQLTVLWRGKPVFIRRRTAAEIEEARAVDWESLPDPQPDDARVKPGRDEWLVMVGVCTHLGCVPLSDRGDFNAWFCPCHGSHYDTSGRIRKGPAPDNLEVPEYVFIDDNTLEIG